MQKIKKKLSDIFKLGIKKKFKYLSYKFDLFLNICKKSKKKRFDIFKLGVGNFVQVRLFNRL